MSFLIVINICYLKSAKYIRASVGIGIGNVFGSLVLGISRNPSLKDELLKMAILGFALMIVFLLLFSLYKYLL